MTNDSSKEFDLIPGQILECEVTGTESDGLYKISSQSLGDVAGFLRCTGELASGTKLEACFVCMHQGVAVFMPREPMHNLKEGAIANTELSIPKFNEEEGVNANIVNLVLQGRGQNDDDARKESVGRILEELREQKVTLEGYFQRNSLLSAHECNSISRGKALMDRGVITWEQFAIAFLDELVTGVKMEESLTLRGWI